MFQLTYWHESKPFSESQQFSESQTLTKLLRHLAELQWLK